MFNILHNVKDNKLNKNNTSNMESRFGTQFQLKNTNEKDLELKKMKIIIKTKIKKREIEKKRDLKYKKQLI